MASSKDILAKLRSLSDPKAVEGMARYGINSNNTLGVSVAELRRMAKSIGKDHNMALELWESGIHEARILATIVEDPRETSNEQLERWVGELDSWDVCDGFCANLVEKTGFAYEKALAWSAREEVFVKRAGFVMMARLAVSDKKAPDDVFEQFLSIIKSRCEDERNFVKKAVNWALRQIGKRNASLNKKAIAVGEQLRRLDSTAAKWIAADALRELTDNAVATRLKKRA